MMEETSSACGACSAKFLCGQSGKMDEACEFPVSVAHKAVRLSYVYPLLLFLLLLLSLSALGVSEWICALAAFAGLGLYYGVLRLLRGRLEKIFVKKI